MLELIVMIVVVVLMARIAEAEKRSGLVWGGLTLVICLLCELIPLPVLRVLIGGTIAFVVMLVSNLMGK